MSVQDRVVVVTGGARRLGRAYSLALGRAGAKVVVADILDGSDVADEIRGAGGQAMAIQADICDENALGRMADGIVQAFGTVDVLINNAGYFRDAARGSFMDVPIAELERSLDVNVKGTWLVTRAVVPIMKKANFGKIVNVSSASVIKGQSATGPHYLVAKAATLGFTRVLARELGPFNIAVNSLLPDAIPDEQADTPATDTSRAVTARCFQRRQTPEDMVGTVLYLCGSGSDFVTGQSFHVNGGAYFT